MLRCTIEKRAAIDSALRSGTSVQTPADENGLSKSALWRHSRHVVGYSPAVVQPKPALPAKLLIPATPKSAWPLKTARPVKTAVPTARPPKSQAILYASKSECLAIQCHHLVTHVHV